MNLAVLADAARRMLRRFLNEQRPVFIASSTEIQLVAKTSTAGLVMLTLNAEPVAFHQLLPSLD